MFALDLNVRASFFVLTGNSDVCPKDRAKTKNHKAEEAELSKVKKYVNKRVRKDNENLVKLLGG